jgi:hypothetical protein
MKPLLLIPALFLAACASHPRHKSIVVVPAIPSRSVSGTDLRTFEQLREYRFGRYVDPGDPLVMHEGHPVYRVETSADRDLHPGSGASPRPRSNANAASTATNDAVVAEVNKQRAMTRAVTEQATTLNQRLAEMTRAAAQADELGKQNVALKREMAALRERIDALSYDRAEAKPARPDRPQPRPDDKW